MTADDACVRQIGRCINPREQRFKRAFSPVIGVAVTVIEALTALWRSTKAGGGYTGPLDACWP